MGIQNVCDGLVEETDGLLACIVLDLDTGLTLANSCREGMEAEAGSAVARRLWGLFRSSSPGFVKSVATPTPLRGVVREAQVTTGNTYHFMATVPGWDSALLVFVTEKAVSIGLGWMAVHQAIDRVLEARPGTAETETAHGVQTSPPAVPQDPPAAPAQRPAAPERPLPPEKQAAEPVRGVASAPTAPGPAVPPAPPRRVAPPATQPPPRAGRSVERDGPGFGALRESTVPDNGQPPKPVVPDAREKPTAREAPSVRPPKPSSVAATGAPAEPADEDAKADIGRKGARAMFGSKARRS